MKIWILWWNSICQYCSQKYKANHTCFQTKMKIYLRKPAWAISYIRWTLPHCWSIFSPNTPEKRYCCSFRNCRDDCCRDTTNIRVNTAMVAGESRGSLTNGTCGQCFKSRHGKFKIFSDSWKDLPIGMKLSGKNAGDEGAAFLRWWGCQKLIASEYNTGIHKIDEIKLLQIFSPGMNRVYSPINQQVTSYDLCW